MTIRKNWVALGAFLITAITAGQLSARAKRRAEEAEVGRRQIERLYQELQAAFERASEAEALRRSEQLKSALLDAVTDDLRTPLTSIKASVTTLLEEGRPTSQGDGESQLKLDDEGRQDMLEVIDEEADRLNHFIEGMVELARIEVADFHLRHRSGAVDEIISVALTRAVDGTRGDFEAPEESEGRRRNKVALRKKKSQAQTRRETTEYRKKWNPRKRMRVSFRGFRFFSVCSVVSLLCSNASRLSLSW